MRKAIVFLILFGLATGLVLGKEGEDWSTYRHDSGHSATSDISLAPPLERLWFTPIGGDVPFEAVNLDGFLYVGSESLLCFNRENAVTEWRFDCPSQITTAALVVKGSAVVGCKDGNVFCINSETAKPRWRMSVGKVTKGFCKKGDFCYFGTDKGDLYCVDIATGNEKFKISFKTPIIAPPAIDSDSLVVALEDGTIICLNADDGKVIWRKDNLAGDGIGGMVVESGVAYFGSFDNNIYAVSTADGSVVWSKRVDGWIGSHPLIYGDEVFFRTKQTTLWCFDKKTGETLWHFAHQPTRVEPIISGDVIYLGSNRRIVAVSASLRKELWHYEFPEEQPLSLSMSDGRLIVGTSLGRIHCFKAGPKLQVAPEKVELEVLTTDEKPFFEVEVSNLRGDNWNTLLRGDITTKNNWMSIIDQVYELPTGQSTKIKVFIILDVLQKVGIHEGELIVTSNGGDQEVIPVTLRYVDPNPPKMCLEHSEIDLGAVTTGTFKKYSFEVKNCGKGKLVISLEAQSLEGWLGIDKNYAEIAPGEGEVFNVVADTTGMKIMPGDDCAKSGYIQIQSNTEASTVIIPVKLRPYGIPLPTTLKLMIGSTRVVLNGKERMISPSPYLSNGRTMVPLRLIGDAFFADVNWDPDEKTITITSCTSKSRFRIGSRKVQVIGMGEVLEQTIDVPPEIYQGRTFIPLRAVTDVFGGRSEWDGKTRTVTITYNP